MKHKLGRRMLLLLLSLLLILLPTGCLPAGDASGDTTNDTDNESKTEQVFETDENGYKLMPLTVFYPEYQRVGEHTGRSSAYLTNHDFDKAYCRADLIVKVKITNYELSCKDWFFQYSLFKGEIIETYKDTVGQSSKEIVFSVSGTPKVTNPYQILFAMGDTVVIALKKSDYYPQVLKDDRYSDVYTSLHTYGSYLLQHTYQGKDYLLFWGEGEYHLTEGLFNIALDEEAAAPIWQDRFAVDPLLESVVKDKLIVSAEDYKTYLKGVLEE